MAVFSESGAWSPAGGRAGLLSAAGIVLAVALVSGVYLALDTRYVYLLVYAWFGVAYGLLLQYGRFCMASAVRDLFMVRVPRMAVGVIVAIVLYALIAAIVHVVGVNTFAPHPLGWHVLIGGAIFGFGMIFTGGCASSSLYKSGEGNVASMLVLLAISVSQALFVSAGSWSNRGVPKAWAEAAAAQDMPAALGITDGWFDQFTAGYLWTLPAETVAQALGVQGAVAGAVANALLTALLPAAALLVLLYATAWRKGYLRRAKLAQARIGDHLRGIWAMLTASKRTALVGLGLGALAGLQMWITSALRDHYGIFNFGEMLAQMGHSEGLSLQDTVFDPGYWYITTQEAQWAGWALDKLGLSMRDNLFFGLDNGVPAPWLNAPGLMSIGIIAGAAVIANLNGEFKWKLPSAETAAFALVGGALMGLGSRIGMGCNIGAFFATVTNGDPSGWIFFAGLVAGGYGGVRAFKWWIDRRLAAAGPA
ncbi:YeeE/YedE thiosulfate transporter family protein [Solimonas flava]|uniref:YeeE/YedE thiosulfate transporter family protein n=1 Tax=Solimonas flava TaxID=415849 RepID=UPI0004139CB4|nr:YeeE/YedE thiosulfate transporter family protein [Solimonas flava]